MLDPKDFFNYDPSTGIITWSKDHGLKIKKGRVVAGYDRDGYLRAKLDGKSYKAHRLAWYLYYGSWPSYEIDHINRNRSDNRIKNLRDATRSQNAKNIKSNTSGLLGVSRKGNGWQAQIQINGIQHYIGFSTEKETAKEMYENFVRSQD